MRKTILAVLGVVVAITAGLVIYWRWFPRAGTKWANDVMNPWLVGHGLSGVGENEIGTLEHFGRKTGARHLTPVHPVPTGDGFRIVVPLAEQSQWAMNVLAAGHCRLQLHDTVFELDEPVLVEPVDVRELSAPVRKAAATLGFKYLRLHRFAEAPGALEPIEAEIPLDTAPVETPAIETPDQEVAPV